MNGVAALSSAWSDEDRPCAAKAYENGIANGVEGLRIIERDELVGMEP